MPTVHDFYNIFDFKRMVMGDIRGTPPILLQNFFRGDLEYIRGSDVDGKDILEVGCGFGRLLPELANRSKAVTGIDSSSLQLSGAREVAATLKNVQVTEMYAEAMAFPTAQFDVSLCMNCTLGNMPHIEKEVIGEMIRVTKPGGKVTIRVFADKEAVRLAQYENYQRLGLTNIQDKGPAIITDEGFYSRRFSELELHDLFKETGITPNIKSDCEAGYLVTADIGL